jgi:hypothetical protein
MWDFQAPASNWMWWDVTAILVVIWWCSCEILGILIIGSLLQQHGQILRCLTENEPADLQDIQFLFKVAEVVTVKTTHEENCKFLANKILLWCDLVRDHIKASHCWWFCFSAGFVASYFFGVCVYVCFKFCLQVSQSTSYNCRNSLLLLWENEIAEERRE